MNGEGQGRECSVAHGKGKPSNKKLTNEAETPPAELHENTHLALGMRCDVPLGLVFPAVMP